MYRDAVLLLAEGVPEGVTWAVTASANLALRGFDIEPGDVDIKTDATGVTTIADAFRNHVVQPVAPPGSSDADWIRSHFAVLELAGTRVELIGDAEFWDARRGQWVAAPSVEGHREWLRVDGIEVPAMTPASEREQYRARGDEARMALLGADP